MMERLNGQMALVLHDQHNDVLLLARDRFGVRPLFISIVNGDLYFGSEVKALFASGEVAARPDLRGLDEVFSLWATRAPRTVFRDVRQIEPGCCCTWSDGRLRERRYYDPRYRESTIEPSGAIETLDELMRSSVSQCMRTDASVGGYLSGGLDSSITCALAARETPGTFRTFSVSFDDARFDESEQQQEVASRLSTEHLDIRVRPNDVAEVFPDVVWHAETPLVQTAPAPMFLLARAARDAGVKVVLTGEGADELFLGYDVFKETMVRLFCLRQPHSRIRPRLFDRLYSYLEGTAQAGEFWRRFFLNAGSLDDALFSHAPRFLIAARIKDFYSAESRLLLAGSDPLAELRQSLPDSFGNWSPENRAAYLELTTVLPSILLSSVGDRMSMAHGVERRLPFLDHRVFEFAAALPSSSKLRGLRDKEILRRWASQFLGKETASRPKQPYRSPDAVSFFQGDTAEYVRELLSPGAIRRTGIFDANAVAGLWRRCLSGRVIRTAENQALVAILSTQLWHRSFIEQSIAGRQPRDASSTRSLAFIS
jgi:asparagine synthase (glutamine-hydrolysing)